MLSKLFNFSDTASPIAAIGNALDQVVTSDEERLQAELLLKKLEQQPAILQVELNKLEAAHRSLFVAGWRPWIGWTCGTALAYVWFLRPLIGDIAALFNKTPHFIPIDTENMMQLIIALLGLGGLRTYEKLKGKAR